MSTKFTKLKYSITAYILMIMMLKGLSMSASNENDKKYIFNVTDNAYLVDSYGKELIYTEKLF